MALYPFSLLEGKDVVLASASPRRRQILHDHLGLNDARVVPSAWPENLDKTAYASTDAWLYENVLGKALDVFHRMTISPDLIIAADTVVITEDGTILEKPADAADAVATLQRLSGQTHAVKTILLLLRPSKTPQTPYTIDYKITETRVTFCDLDARFIQEYVASGHPMDKSGSYGYMEQGAALVSSIQGDYFNVIGFPASTFAQLIKTCYA